MPLPALTGDIVLSDRASEVFRQVAENASIADRALTNVQTQARQTAAAIERALGRPAAPTATPRTAVDDTAVQERIRQAEQTTAQILAIEQRLTQDILTEINRRQAAEQQAATARRQALQLAGTAQQLPGADRMTRQLEELTQRSDEAAAALLRLQQNTNIGARLDRFVGQRAGQIESEASRRRSVAQRLASFLATVEQRITGKHREESRKRSDDDEREQRKRIDLQHGFTRVLAAAGITLGVREIAQQTIALSELGTQAVRTERGFEILSGGAEEAQKRLDAIVRASGGAIDALSATGIATQVSALGLAKTAEGFGRITTAARAVAFVSPVINDIGSAVSELGLASANLSFRRLDQLGLSVSEVKQRIAELRLENENLDDSQLFLQASVDTLVQKYGDLLTTSEAAASGLEILRTRLTEIRVEAGKFVAANLDAPFRDLAIQLGGGELDQLGRVLEDRAERLRAVANTIGDTLADASRLPAFNLLAGAIRETTQAQQQGVAGADDFADAIESIAREFVRTNVLTDEQARKIAELSQQYGIATGAVIQFLAAQGQQAQTEAIDEIERKLNNLRAQSGVPLIGRVLASDEEITRLEDVLAQAQANATRGIPITVDPRVEGIVSGEILRALPDTGVFDELQNAEQRLIDTSRELQAAQERAVGSPEQIQAQTATLQLARDLARSDVELASAKRDIIQATLAYGQALDGIGDKSADVAQADLDAAQKALRVAQARREQIITTEQVRAAEVELQNALATGNSFAIQAAQSALTAANARRQQANSTVELITGERQAQSAVSDTEQAYKAYARSIRQLRTDINQLIGVAGGMPIAFNASIVPASELSTVLDGLAASVRNLALSANQSSLSIARGLVPQLGVGGALGVGREFQQQSQQVVEAFNTINAQRIDEGKSPLNPTILDTALDATRQWQQAYVSDMQTAAQASEKAAGDSGDAWEAAQERIKKATESAIDSITSSVIQPTTEGLIPEDIESQLLPREDAVDEQARHVADVAVNGFQSQFFEGLKQQGIFPQPLLDQGEQAVRVAAARMVRAHTEQLTGMFIDVDKAAEKVVERIRGKENIDAVIAQVRERVQGIASATDLDIQEALGIDTTVERQAQAIGAAVKSAFGNLPQTFEGLLGQITAIFTGGETGESPIAQNLTISPEAQQTIAGSAATAISAAGEAAITQASTTLATNPLADAMTVNTEQQDAVSAATTDMIATAGEAMVTQASTGNYGGRAIDNVIATIEARKEDLEQAGRNAAEWMGGPLVERFREIVPPGLLDVLVERLGPLMAAAQAANAERTAGAGVQ